MCLGYFVNDVYVASWGGFSGCHPFQFGQLNPRTPTAPPPPAGEGTDCSHL